VDIADEGSQLVLAFLIERRISMPIEKYRIDSPTIALFQEEGRHVAHTIPTGAIISTDGKPFLGNKLMEVLWDKKAVMMFAQDIRARGERVD
jgi:hypothetical protein